MGSHFKSGSRQFYNEFVRIPDQGPIPGNPGIYFGLFDLFEGT